MTRSRKAGAPVVDESQQGLTSEELEAKEVVQLPEREALSVAFPFATPVSPFGVAKGAEAVADTVSGVADDAAIDPGA
jgi:hypothetical protein